MWILLIVILVLMIGGAIFSLEARDLLSAVIAYGIVGFGLVIAFLLLQAPDLALVQIVVEAITLIIMIAVILNSTREEIGRRSRVTAVYVVCAIIFAGLFLYFFNRVTGSLSEFGGRALRMSQAYIQPGADTTGSANLVSGVIFDFRGYDTLGEATILFTAVIGVLTVLRLKGRKE
jgi:multisubunit Na+/H+ antiporter MnhB subunit